MSPAGLWLPLEALLELAIEEDSRARLWEIALAQLEGQPGAEPLHVALARHAGQAAAGAAADGQWGVADLHLQQAVGHYGRIGAQGSDLRQAAGQELAGLLGRLISEIHAAVHAETAPPARERGELCWRGYGWVRLLQRLGLPREGWLASLEEQLVREGGIRLREIATSPDSGLEPELVIRLRRQALELLLHLGTLHDPTPEWIGQAARELLQQEVEIVLEADHGPAGFHDEGVRMLLEWLSRLPLEPAAAAAVQQATLRARLSLELLGHGTGAAPAPAPVPAQAAATPSEPSPAPQPLQIAFQQPGDLARHLQLEAAAWMRQFAGQAGAVRLGLTLDPEAPALRTQADRIELNLSPLLAFPRLEQLDALLPALFSPLEGESGGRFRQEEPNGALYGALAALWRRGGGLAPQAFPAVIYACELWSRCAGPDRLGAQPEPWQLPVASLQPGVTLLRPGNVELAALQSVLQRPDELEEALVEIRRHHHDRAWMERRSDRWWMDPADAVENLCRLHTNAGFYASGHAPLESLQRWSQTTIAALLAGPVLFGNDSIVRMFLPVAQTLTRQSGRVPDLVQWPGTQAFYDFIAGEEVLFVTPLAAEVEAHHRSGRAFNLFTRVRIQPYGLRCIPAPMSVFPNRPERGFEDSLERCLAQVERAYQQRPFQVFTAAAGAYGLPLCQAVHRRYGVACVYLGNAMHAHFGIAQITTDGWMADQRRPEHWLRPTGLRGVAGVERIEGGRYLS